MRPLGELATLLKSLTNSFQVLLWISDEESYVCLVGYELSEYDEDM